MGPNDAGSKLNKDSREREVTLQIVGIKSFLYFVKQWELTVSEQCLLLGLDSEAELIRIKTQSTATDSFEPNEDVLTRISYMLGVRKAVEIIYPKERWDTYMRAPNTRFDGASILDLMLEQPDGLKKARAYMDARLGPEDDNY